LSFEIYGFVRQSCFEKERRGWGEEQVQITFARLSNDKMSSRGNSNHEGNELPFDFCDSDEQSLIVSITLG
jgi:hypothetical protein